MTAYGSEFFTMNDVNRLQISQDVVDNRLTTRLARCGSTLPTGTAVVFSNVTDGQARFRSLTAVAVCPGLIAALRHRILTLLRENYVGFGPTLAAEKLQERHGIPVSVETLRC